MSVYVEGLLALIVHDLIVPKSDWFKFNLLRGIIYIYSAGMPGCIVPSAKKPSELSFQFINKLRLLLWYFHSVCFSFQPFESVSSLGELIQIQ